MTDVSSLRPPCARRIAATSFPGVSCGGARVESAHHQICSEGLGHHGSAARERAGITCKQSGRTAPMNAKVPKLRRRRPLQPGGRRARPVRAAQARSGEHADRGTRPASRNAAKLRLAIRSTAVSRPAPRAPSVPGVVGPPAMDQTTRHARHSARPVSRRASVCHERDMRATRSGLANASQTPSEATSTRPPVAGTRTCAPGPPASAVETRRRLSSQTLLADAKKWDALLSAT